MNGQAGSAPRKGLEAMSKDMNKLRADEIAPELARLNKELFELRSKSVTEKVENTSNFKKLRRDIARVLTRRRRLELEAAKK